MGYGYLSVMSLQLKKQYANLERLLNTAKVEVLVAERNPSRLRP